MRELFLSLLHMSLTASCSILAVFVIRLLLQKTQKKYSYYLWSVVAFRLCCPVSFSSVFSLLNIRYLPPFAAADPATSLSDTSTVLTDAGDFTSILRDSASAQTWLMLPAAVWIAGTLTLVACGLISSIRLAGKLRTAIRLKDNVFQSEYVTSPFILGLMRPRIYIPFHLDGQTLHYVLMHENYHLKRHDHILKTAAWLLLAIHWFNPLCWISFHLFCKDMEMSCDEHVLGQEKNSPGDYSDALLSFALRRRFPSPGPLAFGETDIKKRILHILNWKQPRPIASLLSAAVCLAAIFICAANPHAAERQDYDTNIYESRDLSYAGDSLSDITESSGEKSVPDTLDSPASRESQSTPAETDFSENTHFSDNSHAGGHHSGHHHSE